MTETTLFQVTLTPMTIWQLTPSQLKFTTVVTFGP